MSKKNIYGRLILTEKQRHLCSSSAPGGAARLPSRSVLFASHRVTSPACTNAVQLYSHGLVSIWRVCANGLAGSGSLCHPYGPGILPAAARCRPAVAQCTARGRPAEGGRQGGRWAFRRRPFVDRTVRVAAHCRWCQRPAARTSAYIHQRAREQHSSVRSDQRRSAAVACNSAGAGSNVRDQVREECNSRRHVE